MAQQNKNTKIEKVENSEMVVVTKPYKNVAYEAFIAWSAMPHGERKAIDLKTQGEFCERYDIHPNTPAQWKALPDFRARVRDLRDKWAFDKTQEVIEGMRIAAVGGNAMSQLLWLQYFEGFDPKKQAEKTEKVEISVGDIRFLIEALPEPLKSEHYANLRKLLDDSTAFANSREIESGDRAEGSAPGVQGEADHDASHVPVTETHAVATRHPISVCADMERKASSSHHQGASWGG